MLVVSSRLRGSTASDITRTEGRRWAKGGGGSTGGGWSAKKLS
eukprot:06017.XXX_35632_35760_1 [CDS] Oithona nana genome sequencing.